MIKSGGLVAGLVWAAAGACGGGDAAPSFTPVSATNQGDLYTLQLGVMKMVVDAAKGARITEFSFQATNVLTGRDVDHDNYGSTYWPSPQSSWCTAGGGCWPPPAAIDNQPYAGAIDAATNSIQLTSGEATIAGLPGSAVTLTKQLTPVPDSGAIDVTYTLNNSSASVTVTVAPWQVSRVAIDGLTFFGKGAGDVTYASNTDPAFMVTEAGGDLWYAFAPVTTYSKANADGTGWLAHVTPDRLLYLLAFPDIQPADAAPGEAEIEVFTSGAYVELETQGALSTVAPGASLTWTVRWQLRRLRGTAVAPGSTDLEALAMTTLSQ